MVSANDNRTLSPRELASAIGVSESSVKRWIDAGRVPAKLTPGGHRRIEVVPALRFVRETGRELAQPGLLGLAAPSGSGLQGGEQFTDRLFELLRSGNGEELARALLTALVTRTMEPAALFDGPVRSAMARIGDLWQGDHRGVYVEHRATQILLRAIDPIDALFEPPPDDLIAIGGSIEGDPSVLPTRMAATVLASVGVHPVNLGADTPAPAFLDAAERIGARLVWISAGHVGDPARLSTELSWLLDHLAERNIACILGGREVDKLQLDVPGKARVGESLQDLVELAGRIRQASAGRRLG